jgi:uncharacterized protein (TIGR03086 family)
MDLLDAHGRAMRGFDRVVLQVGKHQWQNQTPCTEWDVRDLVNHLVAEQLWVPHLLAGTSLDEVGDRFDGDVLGSDPIQAWSESATTARSAWTAPGAREREVHVTSGVIGAEEYGWQMTLDLAVHGWDLATAIGAPDPIDPDLAQSLLEHVAPEVEQWQGAGIFAPPVEVGADASPSARLVGLLGRDPR